MDGESEVHSESVTTAGGGGRRKRRQTVAPLPQTPGESRYNLRRHKTEDTAPEAKDSTNNRKKKEVSETKKHDTAPATETEAASDVVSKPSVPVTTSKRTEIQILDTAFETQGDVAGSSGAMKIVKHTEIIEEVNVAHEDEEVNVNDNDNGDGDGKEEGDDDEEVEDEDEDDDSEQHPGEVSIGKKIWKFLST